MHGEKGKPFLLFLHDDIWNYAWNSDVRQFDDNVYVYEMLTLVTVPLVMHYDLRRGMPDENMRIIQSVGSVCVYWIYLYSPLWNEHEFYTFGGCAGYDKEVSGHGPLLQNCLSVWCLDLV